MMPDDTAARSICLPARFTALPALLAVLSASDRTESFDKHTLLRAQTAVEELFANSIHHGYGGESEQPVWLSVQRADGELRIVYADAAPAFDPLGHLDRLPGKPERLGGAGRHLVHGLADASAYRYHQQRNEITLRFRPRPTA